jgi:hypothetical protein
VGRLQIARSGSFDDEGVGWRRSKRRNRVDGGEKGCGVVLGG